MKIILFVNVCVLNVVATGMCLYCTHINVAKVQFLQVTISVVFLNLIIAYNLSKIACDG